MLFTIITEMWYMLVGAEIQAGVLVLGAIPGLALDSECHPGRWHFKSENTSNFNFFVLAHCKARL